MLGPGQLREKIGKKGKKTAHKANNCSLYDIAILMIYLEGFFIGEGRAGKGDDAEHCNCIFFFFFLFFLPGIVLQI